MRFESTIQRPVETSGVGLHHGVPVNIRILPAPPGTGIVFIRTDLNNFSIPARWKFVQRVSYATSLMRRSVLISTTEHLLSVFYSMGIDNAYVEIDNLEVPILDGSGAPFVRLIQEAGIQTSRKRRKYLRVLRPVSRVKNSSRFSSTRPSATSVAFSATSDSAFFAPTILAAPSAFACASLSWAS